MGPVVDELHQTEELTRLWKGGRSRDVHDSLHGMGRGDPANFASDDVRILDGAEQTAAARAFDERVEMLKARFPRDDFGCCREHDGLLLRVATGSRLGGFPVPDFSRKKVAALVLALSDHQRQQRQQQQQQQQTPSALSTLFQAVGGGEPTPEDDYTVYRGDLDGDEGIAGLEGEVFQSLPPDEQRVSPLKVLRVTRNLLARCASRDELIPRESQQGLAEAVRAFLVRVTSGFDAPFRLEPADLGILEVIESFPHLNETPQRRAAILLAADALAVRACDRQILARFARIHRDLLSDPVELTGLRGDVLELVYALSPPGLENPLAALVLVRSGLFSVSDPTVFDPSGAIASRVAFPCIPYDLPDRSAIVGAVKTIGTSLLALPPGEITVSDPLHDLLAGRGDAVGEHKPVVGRIISAICETFHYDLSMAYHKGMYGAVIVPKEERASISSEREAGEEVSLAVGDELLRQERPERSSLPPTASHHGAFVNSPGASGAAALDLGGDRSHAGVNAATTALCAHRPLGGKEKPAFVAAGEASCSPEVLDAEYDRSVHVHRTGHEAGGKGILVS